MEDVMGSKITDEQTELKYGKDRAMKQLDEVESTKAEMTGVRQENIQLKTMLQKIEKDYKTLQMKFVDIFKQESNKTTIIASPENTHEYSDEDREHELVSLRLGTVTESRKDEVVHVTSSTSNSSKSTSTETDNELKLGLDYNNREGLKRDHAKSFPGKNEDDSDGKVLKTEKSADEEIVQTSVKRARVCVRARCDTPTMNDGCQWRKYGQKIAKGNPCPRAYYRCTVSPSCPVRKQVQRCVDDMSILITSYEGTHNHPLPASATAMASTTSAAASMLLSGSSTSNSTTSLYGPPFQSARSSQPYYYHNSSSAPFPTITLDLTTNPSTTSTGFGLYSSNSRPTNLSFGSNMIPFSYGALQNNNNHPSFDFGKQQKQHNYQSLFEKGSMGNSQQALTETLTKVITSDPNFRSVIAAAISSMAANNSNGGVGKIQNNDNKHHIQPTDSNSLS